MDKRMREKVADRLAEAAHEVFEVAGELDDIDDGAPWVELSALFYLCLSDLVRTGGTEVKLTLPQAKRLADAHVMTMQAWAPVDKHIKENPNITDEEVRHQLALKDMGNAEGIVWNLVPYILRVKTLLPAWAWPDHPENDRRVHGRR